MKMKTKSKKYLFKEHKAEVVNHAFQTLLVTYLILLLTEQIWTGVVSLYINLNYLLIAVIIAGILDVFSEHHPNITGNKKKTQKKDYVFIFILGILGFAIIKYKTSSLNWLSWVISIIAGILIILLSILVLEEENEVEKD